MPWDAFGSHQNLIGKANNENSDVETMECIKARDKKLFHLWRDLCSFATLCNLASQSANKLPPNTFSELLISALYRLLSLSYPKDIPCEALRLGMVSLTAYVFFQWRGIRQRLDGLDAEFQRAVRRLAASSHDKMPVAVRFWLVTLSEVLSAREEDMELQEICSLMKQLKITSERDAISVLKTVVWIDSIHIVRLRSILQHISSGEN